MKIYDARKILSELKDVHGFVSADDEKTLDLISKMIAGKPKAEADPRFLENLRNRLLLEASAPVVSPWWKTWQSFARFLSVPVALAGIAAIAGTLGLFDVAGPKGTPYVPKYPVAMTFTDSGEKTAGEGFENTRPPLDGTDSRTLAAVPKIEESAPLPSLRGTAWEKTETSAKPVTAPKPGPVSNPVAPVVATSDDRTLESVDSGISNIVGDTSENVAADAPMADSMDFSAPMALTSPAGSSALKMGTPENVKITEYRYSYSGELPKITTPLPTYERTAKLPLPAFAKASDVGMSVSQDVENGYSTIMRDYQKWPEVSCETEQCAKAALLKESDVPADSAIVAVARGFARDMGIDLSSYATPVVDHSWKNALAQTSDPSSKIVPENLTVVFPRKVDGYEIQDDSGYPTGVTFIVNHPSKRVQQVIGIESSTLSTVSKVSTVSQTAVTVGLSNGGSTETSATQDGSETVTVEMSRAKLGYSVRYAEKNGKWVEFYVPSIIFETDRMPKAGEYFKTRVVVPLAEVTKG